MLKGQPLWVSGNIGVLNKPCSLGPTLARRSFATVSEAMKRWPSSPELQSTPPRALPSQKQPRIFQEVLGILRICTVARIRVHDELSVWQMLRQNESVDRNHYDVFVALNNERRMCDAFQGGVTSGGWYRSPLPDRGKLGNGRVPRHRKITITFARLESLDVFAPSSLAGLRRREEGTQQERHGIRLLFRR